MAHPDLDELANALIPFAQQMVEEQGGFLPFGACVMTNGELRLIAGDAGDERPPASQLIDLLVEGLRARARAGEVRAGGVCYDAKFEPSDGSAVKDTICASLDHESGESVDVLLPYSTDSASAPEYGEIAATQGSIAIFGLPEGTA